MKTVTTDNKPLLERIEAARKNFGEIVKASTNPFHNSRYADLNAYLHAIVEPLAKEGVSVIQPLEIKLFEGIGLVVVVTTRLTCPTGEMLDSSLPIPQQIDPQKMGAAVTYYRRYTLASLLALGAEDDDAESAKPVTARPTPPQFKAKKPEEFDLSKLKDLKEYLEKNSAKIPKLEYVALKGRFDELKAEYLKQQKPKKETTHE